MFENERKKVKKAKIKFKILAMAQIIPCSDRDFYCVNLNKCHY